MVTDGPALRIAIDRNGNGVIDSGGHGRWAASGEFTAGTHDAGHRRVEVHARVPAGDQHRPLRRGRQRQHRRLAGLRPGEPRRPLRPRRPRARSARTSTASPAAPNTGGCTTVTWPIPPACCASCPRPPRTSTGAAGAWCRCPSTASWWAGCASNPASSPSRSAAPTSGAASPDSRTSCEIECTEPTTPPSTFHFDSPSRARPAVRARVCPHPDPEQRLVHRHPCRRRARPEPRPVHRAPRLHQPRVGHQTAGTVRGRGLERRRRGDATLTNLLPDAVPAGQPSRRRRRNISVTTSASPITTITHQKPPGAAHPGQAADVHAEHAGDEGDGQQGGGDHRQHEQVAVGGLGQQAGDLFLQQARPLLHQLQVLGDAVQRFDRLPQVLLLLGAERRRQPRRQRAQRRPVGAQVAAQPGQRAAHPPQRLALALEAAGQDVLLGVVHLVGQPGHRLAEGAARQSTSRSKIWIGCSPSRRRPAAPAAAGPSCAAGAGAR